MRERRNPFRLRASEHLSQEHDFVRLFSPGVLKALEVDGLWDLLRVIRSGPGAGKTSLLRLFTPRSLITVCDLRDRDNVKDLFRTLRKLGAVGADGPKVLGILTSCAHSYATLADWDFDKVIQNRLLASLFNARIVLSFLKAAASLHGLQEPEDLAGLRIDESQVQLPRDIPARDGLSLYKWACDLERRVCKTLDSFGPVTEKGLPGAHDLFSLHMLKPDSWVINGTRLADKIVLMVDDVHRLTAIQRQFLIDAFCVTRPPVAVWLAERLEAMNSDELLSSGARVGRDFGEAIYLEDYWRERDRRQFEKFVIDVADRRVENSTAVHVASFEECLKHHLEGQEWNDRFNAASINISKRLLDRFRINKNIPHGFHSWIVQTWTLVREKRL